MNYAYDYDFNKDSILKIQKSLYLNGFAILRNALNVDLVEDYKAKIDFIYNDTINKIKAGDTSLDENQRNHIREVNFKKYFGQDKSLFGVINSKKFKSLFDEIFGTWHEHEDSVSRSVDLLKNDIVSFPPLMPHIDHLYHANKEHFAINVWVPFSECGKGTKKPGFLAYQAGYKKIREILGFEEFEKVSNASQDQLEMRTVFDLMMQKYPDIPPIGPKFQVGDCIIITSWTLHATYYEEAMNEARRSLELRVRGEHYNPQPPAGIAKTLLHFLKNEKY